jgi:hypothetical protein
MGEKQVAAAGQNRHLLPKSRRRVEHRRVPAHRQESAGAALLEDPQLLASAGRALRTDVGRAMSGAAGWVAACVGVPTISRFFGISIAMFFDDHGPPHFHARHAEGNAKVRIDSLEVIESDLPRRQLRFVLAWRNYVRTSCARTGVAPAPLRHFGRSSRSDDWPDARHH